MKIDISRSGRRGLVGVLVVGLAVALASVPAAADGWHGHGHHFRGHHFRGHHFHHRSHFSLGFSFFAPIFPRPYYPPPVVYVPPPRIYYPPAVVVQPPVVAETPACSYGTWRYGDGAVVTGIACRRPDGSWWMQ